AGLVDQFNLSTGEIKDLSVAALIAQLLADGGSDGMRSQLVNLLGMASSLNLTDQSIGTLMEGASKNGKA
ncbi:MAG: hypothetical protein AAGG44_20790, partial [Planctomycetota bacterium]